MTHVGESAAQTRWSLDPEAREAKRERVMFDYVPEIFRERLEGAPFFFLATSGPDGRCDCSFKGGGPGIIRIPRPDRCLFPDFAGNDFFMSLGNVLANPNVGLLFIDFRDGARLRMNGRARVHDDGPALERFPGAPRVVEVEIEQIVLNCSRFVPRWAPDPGAPLLED